MISPVVVQDVRLPVPTHTHTRASISPQGALVLVFAGALTRDVLCWMECKHGWRSCEREVLKYWSTVWWYYGVCCLTTVAAGMCSPGQPVSPSQRWVNRADVQTWVIVSLLLFSIVFLFFILSFFLAFPSIIRVYMCFVSVTCHYIMQIFAVFHPLFLCLVVQSIW